MLLVNDAMEILQYNWTGLVAIIFLIFSSCCYFFYRRYYKKNEVVPTVSDQELQQIQKEIRDLEVKKRRAEMRRIKWLSFA
ncbi:hypothetical protein HGB07_06735 [Candidatus Roizmanbacteria bacterium]|nr:hypothetical protein [Candidatus Roizmanbacteria bacterium]